MRPRKTLTIFLLAMGLVFALSAWAQQNPLTQDQVQGLVRSGLGDDSGAKLIEQRGIDFTPSEDFLQSLKAGGASEAFLKALRLNLNNDWAHVDLGVALGNKGDWDGEIAEERAALRLNPKNDMAHVDLGVALGGKGDWDGAIAEERAALRLNPKNDMAHVDLGVALGGKADWDGAIAEERAALRLNPNNGGAHNYLGNALYTKGDLDGAIKEYREALSLDPKIDKAHYNLGTALGDEGDWDGEIAEEREALRLNPNYAKAHFTLGAALGDKGDWDGEIAEEREALRLNLKNGLAHFVLGVGLEKNGDRQGALEEYRAAYTLNPTNATYRQNYQRLRALPEANRPAGIGATRTSPPAEATTPRASVSAPTTFASYKIEVHPGEPEDEDNSSSWTPAEVCAVSTASKLCYTPPPGPRGIGYGYDPVAKKVSLREPDDALLFLPSEFTGTASANTLLALLQIRNGHLVNILPLTTLSVLSDYGLWKEPDISQAPIVVVANYVWGEGESRMGSKHRFYVESFTMQPSGDYGLFDKYVTTNKYDSEPGKMGVLSTERPAILARLRQATASSAETHGSQAVLTGRDQITSLLNDWVDSFKQKDVARQVACYALQVDIYYRKHNVSRAFVEADKSRAIARLAEIRKFELSNVNVSLDSAEAATVTFDKSWDTTLTSGRRFAGSEMERLGLAFVDGRWKIRSEEEVQIYHVAK